MKWRHRYPGSSSTFSRVASGASHWSGHPVAFILAALIIVAWLITGPLFHFSDTWQLIINTGTTIVTFLMVFLLQHTQNRDSTAVQLKLDELIRAIDGAHNALLDIEELDQRHLDAIRRQYAELAKQAREELAKGERDTGQVSLTLVSDDRDRRR